ncbi:MAG: Asp-tRNA(Asn)/Glu-tRNA(Gln) amidotransferase subunit GatC [Candidatus Adiutrix sp.]|jgi:aspartyl-tRNA(Asn)/glutamyl-tRNA(Gln) amidotransferase subunit C|nr:Asp-tRNA(Asn)/Glu-tRNA(Gln) amidotransferase subunit GatC [Candidatus Adiutrix sp.]
MPIDLTTVLHTAELARLDLTYGLAPDKAQAALDKLAAEMSGIIGHFDQLSAVDTEGVEPLYSPMLEPLGPREDCPRAGSAPEDLLSQAPERLGHFFAVPKIL